MTVKEKDLFFRLLSLSLGNANGTFNATSYNEEEVEHVIKAFNAHALLGMVADTIATYCELSQKQEDELLHFVGKLLKMHYDLDEEVKAVCHLLESNNIKPVLLKGQGLAAIYPVQHTRTCGDIDIFVGQVNYLRACEIVDEYCGVKGRKPFFDESNIHWPVDKGQVHFEIHYRAADTAITSIKDEYNQWIEPLLLASCANVTIHGCNIQVPDTHINVIYVFEHLLKHFRYEGVGFRQFVDWLLLLRKFAEENNGNAVAYTQLRERLTHFHLLDAWQVLSGILVYQLGASAEEIPFWNARKARYSQGRNLQYIIDSENLGRGTASSKGYYYMPQTIKRRLYAFRYYLRFVWFEYHVFPYDTLKVYFNKIKSF